MSGAARRLRISVVGNPGLDTLVLLDQDDLDLHADGYFVRNVDTVGHAPAFVARALARLGHHVRLLGAVGADAIGRMVTDVLAEDGVRTELVFTDPAGTPRSVNLVFPDARRTFFYDGGSHMTLHPRPELVEAALDDCDLVVSSLPNWGRHVVAAARGRGIPVAVDLQDVRAIDDPYRADFVAAADYLFASAAHLTDPLAAARLWMATGSARVVVLGQGARGATLVARSTEQSDHGAPRLGDARGNSSDSGEVRDGAGVARFQRQPAPPLPPGHDLPLVDTTGAGDSLAVGFLDGLLALDLAPEAALLRGQLLARIVASSTGADAPFDRGRLDDLVRLAAAWQCTEPGPPA